MGTEGGYRRRVQEVITGGGYRRWLTELQKGITEVGYGRWLRYLREADRVDGHREALVPGADQMVHDYAEDHPKDTHDDLRQGEIGGD